MGNYALFASVYIDYGGYNTFGWDSLVGIYDTIKEAEDEWNKNTYYSNFQIVDLLCREIVAEGLMAGISWANKPHIVSRPNGKWSFYHYPLPPVWPVFTTQYPTEVAAIEAMDKYMRDKESRSSMRIIWIE